jgi:uncharacterized protein (TIGR02996 family)
MTHDEAFLQAIHEEPTSDAPRLIYADWLEEHGDATDAARAEFIRVQCRLIRLPSEDLERPALEARAVELLREHWADWVGPLRELVGPMYSRYGEGWMGPTYSTRGLAHFSRGFVETLTLAADAFLRHADTLARLTPLRHLRLWGGGRFAEALAAAPHLSWLATLDFEDYYQYPLLARDVRALATSPYLTRLTTLRLFQNSVGDDGLEALAQAPWLAGLEVLDLTDNGISDRGVSALAASSLVSRLSTLDLTRNMITDQGAGALADSPYLARLKRLDLMVNPITAAGREALAFSPHLRRLTTLKVPMNP